jgi:small subunit ribosomal protein S20
MANHASALKAHRQSITRKSRNRSNRSAFRTALKDFTDVLKSKNVADAKTDLPKIYSEIDSAVDKGVLSKNAASRHKSRLTKRLNAANPPAAK